MELNLTARETPVWLSGAPQQKTLRVSAESVIPDTREDLDRILWTQGELLLKGKELSSHSVALTGEARAAVLYLTEGEGRPAWLRLQKPFRLEFETGENDERALPQATLRLTGLEARAVNPRKLAADFGVTAELRSFTRGSLTLENTAPEQPGLHLLTAERQALGVAAVCEKPFTLREQFPVGTDRPVPGEIAGETLAFRDLRAEQLGGRCVVKGELSLEVWGLTGEGEPARLRFAAPFSQLLEPGEETLDEIALSALPGSVYLDWVEPVGGERALDAEIHGVLQLCGWTRFPVRTVEDAYSTRAACTPCRETRRMLTAVEQGSAAVSGEELLTLPEEGGSLLDVQPSLGEPAADREALRLPLGLELLFRRADGGLVSVHRSLTLTGTPPEEGCRCLSGDLSELDLRPEEDGLRVRAEGQVAWERLREEDLRCVASLTLEEREPDAARSDLYLVRRGGESLWELAKTYGSSVEAIRALNGEEGSLLLIPAENGDEFT